MPGAWGFTEAPPPASLRNMQNEWERFFDEHARVYDDECFVQATVAEIAFLRDELALEPGMRVLEVGCGTGRHTLELARLGCRVTAIDLSAGMLARAREKAAVAGVASLVDFVQADAAAYRAAGPHDAAICLCEGALCLLGAGDDPFERDLVLLRNIAAALRPGARFVVNVLNGFRAIRAATEEQVATGGFDPLTLVTTTQMHPRYDETLAPIVARERHYVPSEFTLLLRAAGFAVEHVWRGTAGQWARERPRLDDWELLFIARRN
jgi:SAM-dependent methyltransferase